MVGCDRGIYCAICMNKRGMSIVCRDTIVSNPDLTSILSLCCSRLFSAFAFYCVSNRLPSDGLMARIRPIPLGKDCCLSATTTPLQHGRRGHRNLRVWNDDDAR